MALTFRLNGGLTGLDWDRAKWGGFATKYIKWGEKQAVKYADKIIVLSRGVQKYFTSGEYQKYYEEMYKNR